jgi:hypothetical protein
VFVDGMDGCSNQYGSLNVDVNKLVIFHFSSVHSHLQLLMTMHYHPSRGGDS